VNAMRRRPLSGSEIGAVSGKPVSAPRGLTVFWEVSAPKSGSEFGEPGESIIRPAIAVAKAPQCPYPLTSRYRQGIRGASGNYPPRYRRYWRPVTAPAATIPLAFGPFTSALGNREHRYTRPGT
jgi:hypothetical protein